MNSDELYEMVELLAKQVSPESSEERKITVLNDIKPSSFAWVIETMLDYIEQTKKVFLND